MHIQKSTWMAVLVALTVVVGLPVAGRLSRQAKESACALDGNDIDPRYRIEIADANGSHAFCCLHCAELWLKHRSTRPSSIVLTDEVSGEPVSAKDAWYVRSEVITNLKTRNRVHVFRNRADAELHAAKCLGAILTEPALPIQEE